MVPWRRSLPVGLLTLPPQQRAQYRAASHAASLITPFLARFPRTVPRTKPTSRLAFYHCPPPLVLPVATFADPHFTPNHFSARPGFNPQLSQPICQKQWYSFYRGVSTNKTYRISVRTASQRRIGDVSQHWTVDILYKHTAVHRDYPI